MDREETGGDDKAPYGPCANEIECLAWSPRSVSLGINRAQRRGFSSIASGELNML